MRLLAMTGRIEVWGTFEGVEGSVMLKIVVNGI